MKSRVGMRCTSSLHEKLSLQMCVMLQGFSRLGGPPAPLAMHGSIPTAAAATGSSSYFGGGAGFGSGPSSRDGSRVTLSNAASLNPAASLGLGGLAGYASAGSGGFGSGFGSGGSGGQRGLHGSGSVAEFNERLAQLDSGRIDDIDF